MSQSENDVNFSQYKPSSTLIDGHTRLILEILHGNTHSSVSLPLEDIRQATNKAWILGSQYFKDKIEQQLNRRLTPLPKGGDRKMAAYREQAKINQD